MYEGWYRNINPYCFWFILSFKTLLINNLTSIKSAENCELDYSDELLDNLKQLSVYSPEINKTNDKNDSINIPIIQNNQKWNSTITDINIDYVAGYLAKNFWKPLTVVKLVKYI